MDRRAEELATRSPLGAGRAPRSDTDVSAGPGPASEGRETRPFAHLACAPGREARGSQGPSRRAARHRPSVPTVPKGTWWRKYRNELFMAAEIRVTSCSRTTDHMSRSESRRLRAEAAVPFAVGPERAQEVNAAECGPVCVAEVE